MFRSVSLVFVLFFGLISYAKENPSPAHAFDLSSEAEKAFQCPEIERVSQGGILKKIYINFLAAIKDNPNHYFSRRNYLTSIHPASNHIFHVIEDHVHWTFVKKLKLEEDEFKLLTTLRDEKSSRLAKKHALELYNEAFQAKFAQLSKKETYVIFDYAVIEAVECFEALFKKPKHTDPGQEQNADRQSARL